VPGRLRAASIQRAPAVRRAALQHAHLLFRRAPKILRNKIYLACAITMAACIAGIALWIFVLEARLPQLVPVEPVFWFEAIAIVAFGFSWLTKSEVIFPG
jgi:hypothetical protein